jgi:transcriptional regulator with XRE-family HTH domain
MNKEFGQRLQRARQFKSLTGRECAKAIGIDPAFWSLLESGKRMPSTKVLMKICRYLDVSADYLLFGVEFGPRKFEGKR